MIRLMTDEAMRLLWSLVIVNMGEICATPLPSVPTWGGGGGGREQRREVCERERQVRDRIGRRRDGGGGGGGGRKGVSDKE